MRFDEVDEVLREVILLSRMDENCQRLGRLKGDESGSVVGRKGWEEGRKRRRVYVGGEAQEARGRRRLGSGQSQSQPLDGGQSQLPKDVCLAKSGTFRRQSVSPSPSIVLN